MREASMWEGIQHACTDKATTVHGLASPMIGVTYDHWKEDKSGYIRGRDREGRVFFVEL